MSSLYVFKPMLFKSVRKASGMSQADIASALGVSDRTVSAWENGTRIPKDILGLADVLQISVFEIVDKKSEKVSGEALLKAYHEAEPSVQKAIRVLLGLEVRT